MVNPAFPFQFIGNDLVLDFVNTRIVNGSKAIDLIENRDQIANWFQDVGIDTSMSDWSDDDLSQLYLLRDAIRDVLPASNDAQTPDANALSRINAHLAHQVTQSRLTFDGAAFHIEGSQSHLTPQATMSLLASRTAALLASTRNDLIKVCAGQKCVLVFKDTSKSGRRKWCSMETCGNRTKASKFRENNAD